MADTRPTPVGFFGAVRLCVLLLLRPKRFVELEAEDTAKRGGYNEQGAREHGAHIVRRAFLYSLVLVALSGLTGYGAGVALGWAVGCATPGLISVLQVAGASVLLWGTLFVRGWEIETYYGVTLTERVSQWLYRSLYCLGTAIVLCSVARPQCA